MNRDIITLGASAGGVEALREVAGGLPADLPAAVFVVLHIPPYFPSNLPRILSGAGPVPAEHAQDGAPIRPNRIYIAPPDMHLILEHGRMVVRRGPKENRFRPSIDALFRSASVAYGRQVSGVVLTGNLDDGSAGLACIKSRGGLAIVQDPDEAMAPSMPTSAIESVQVDFILPAEEIGPKLVELAPTQVEEKVQAIEGGNGNIHSTGQSYPCPECGGVLNEVEEGEMVRFRCRVGHLYSPESLLADQSESVERALWAAIRSMEEQAEFSDRMAANSRQKQRPALARRFSGKAEGSRANATVLRDLLQKAAEDILEVPEERTGTD